MSIIRQPRLCCDVCGAVYPDVHSTVTESRDAARSAGWAVDVPDHDDTSKAHWDYCSRHRPQNEGSTPGRNRATASQYANMLNFLAAGTDVLDEASVRWAVRIADGCATLHVQRGSVAVSLVEPEYAGPVRLSPSEFDTYVVRSLVKGYARIPATTTDLRDWLPGALDKEIRAWAVQISRMEHHHGD